MKDTTYFVNFSLNIAAVKSNTFDAYFHKEEFGASSKAFPALADALDFVKNIKGDYEICDELGEIIQARYDEKEAFVAKIKRESERSREAACRLQEIRRELQLDGEEFAELLGVSFRTLKKWECGEKEVPKTALNLAELMLENELTKGKKNA